MIYRNGKVESYRCLSMMVWLIALSTFFPLPYIFS